jgi:thiol-disulfide isomerase/thioredoxin
MVHLSINLINIKKKYMKKIYKQEGNTALIAIILGLIIIGGGAYLLLNKSNNNQALEEQKKAMMQEDDSKKDEGAMEENKNAMMENTNININTNDSMMEEDKMMAEAGAYVSYSQSAYEAAKDKTRILFFHATWCPTCKAANADFEANLDKIPTNVFLFKTDYDKETSLKQKYAITYQHTFVLVDASGQAIKKWSGGSIDELIKNIL